MARAVVALVLIVGLSAAAPAAAQAPYKAPRTPFGQPDFEGVWNTSFILPLEARADAPNLVATEAESKAAWARASCSAFTRLGLSH